MSIARRGAVPKLRCAVRLERHGGVSIEPARVPVLFAMLACASLLAAAAVLPAVAVRPHPAAKASGSAGTIGSAGTSGSTIRSASTPDAAAFMSRMATVGAEMLRDGSCGEAVRFSTAPCSCVN